VRLHEGFPSVTAFVAGPTGTNARVSEEREVAFCSDGRCELVVRELRDDGGKNKFDAYLVTSVYTVENARWQQLLSINDRALPILTKWQINGISDQLPTSDPPTDGRRILMADLSNSIPLHQGSFIRARTRRGPEWLFVSSMGIEFRISGCGPDVSYSSDIVLVDDAPSGRTITEVAKEEIVAELARLQDIDRRHVLLFGRCGNETQSPSGVWVER
jgi:hypothetical protein